MLSILKMIGLFWVGSLILCLPCKAQSDKIYRLDSAAVKALGAFYLGLPQDSIPAQDYVHQANHRKNEAIYLIKNLPETWLNLPLKSAQFLTDSTRRIVKLVFSLQEGVNPMDDLERKFGASLFDRWVSKTCELTALDWGRYYEIILSDLAYIARQQGKTVEAAHLDFMKKRKQKTKK